MNYVFLIRTTMLFIQINNISWLQYISLIKIIVFPQLALTDIKFFRKFFKCIPRNDEYRLECRRLNRGSFLLKKEERKKDFLQISWNRLNELLTVKKYRKTVEK